MNNLSLEMQYKYFMWYLLNNATQYNYVKFLVCMEKQEEQELQRLQGKWHICTLRTGEVWNSTVGPLETVSDQLGE